VPLSRDPSQVQSSNQICKDMMNCTVAGYAGGEGIASSATLAVEWWMVAVA
jgi:hypothetical protein